MNIVHKNGYGNCIVLQLVVNTTTFVDFIIRFQYSLHSFSVLYRFFVCLYRPAVFFSSVLLSIHSNIQHFPMVLHSHWTIYFVFRSLFHSRMEWALLLQMTVMFSIISNIIFFSLWFKTKISYSIVKYWNSIGASAILNDYY